MKEKEEVKKQRKEPYHFSPAQMQLIEEYMDCSMTKLKTLCRTIWLKDTLDQKYYDDLYDDAMTVLMETVESYNPEHEKKASFNPQTPAEFLFPVPSALPSVFLSPAVISQQLSAVRFFAPSLPVPWFLFLQLPHYSVPA